MCKDNFIFSVLLLFQTGSGKTFTITGGAERYIDRGIIPRMLSYIFECFEKVNIALLLSEIYNKLTYSSYQVV